MIRTILGLLVPAALRAIDEAEARATAADANCYVEQGRCAELRDLFAAGLQTAENLRFDLSEALDRATAQAREIETLRSEVASASEECDDVANLRIDLGRAEIRIGQLQRERDELQRRLDARGEVASAEESREACAWCLGPDSSCATTGDDGAPIRICRDHWRADYPHTHDIRARVATRAASCPTRRTSPDPLAIACPTCLVNAGERCHASLVGRATSDTVTVGR